MSIKIDLVWLLILLRCYGKGIWGVVDGQWKRKGYIWYIDDEQFKFAPKIKKNTSLRTLNYLKKYYDNPHYFRSVHLGFDAIRGNDALRLERRNNEEHTIKGRIRDTFDLNAWNDKTNHSIGVRSWKMLKQCKKQYYKKPRCYTIRYRDFLTNEVEKFYNLYPEYCEWLVKNYEKEYN